MGIYSYYADGKWLEPASGEYFETENPCTGEAWAQIPRCNEKDVEIAFQAAYRARQSGAKLSCGGNAVKPGGVTGWFIEPTIFTDVTPDMPLVRDEVFGPVLAVIPFNTEEEALEIANDSNFGLAAGNWTEDHRPPLHLANRLEAGSVYLNIYFDACTQSPVGGYKQSGYGRENGWERMRNFLQTKSVWLSTAREIPPPF